MKKFLLVLVAAMTMAANVFAAADQPQDTWDRGRSSSVIVFGHGSPADYTGYKGSRVARESSIADGIRVMTNYVYSILVDANTTVGDLVGFDANVKANITALINNSRLLAEGNSAGDRHWVRLGIPMYGDNSLVSCVIPALVRTEQAKKVKPFRVTKKNTVMKPEEFELVRREFYSGLVIDARGLGLSCTAAPVIYDTDGRYIYGLRSVDPGYVVTDGVVEYIREGASVKYGKSRGGDNPLVIKATTVRGGHSAKMVDIVVSPFDGDRILLANDANRYLFRNGAVVVVL